MRVVGEASPGFGDQSPHLFRLGLELVHTHDLVQDQTERNPLLGLRTKNVGRCRQIGFPGSALLHLLAGAT